MSDSAYTPKPCPRCGSTDIRRGYTTAPEPRLIYLMCHHCGRKSGARPHAYAATMVWNDLKHEDAV